MRNILLLLSYDGKGFSGFQVQEGRKSIQGTVEAVLEAFTGESVKIVSSGRTDAGVHAVSQVVNFNTSSRLEPETFSRVLNSRLPPAVRVRHAREVSLDFNSRKHAIRKTYRYVIYNGAVLPPFYDGYAWHVKSPIPDATVLREGARLLEGEHDFRAFMGSGSSVKDTVRNIEKTAVAERGELIIISFTGNGFLKNMVRNMVGTMVDVSRGKLKKDSVRDILRSKDRRQAGRCAPGEGLYLLGVDYRDFSFEGSLPFILDFQQDID